MKIIQSIITLIIIGLFFVQYVQMAQARKQSWKLAQATMETGYSGGMLECINYFTKHKTFPGDKVQTMMEDYIKRAKEKGLLKYK